VRGSETKSTSFLSYDRAVPNPHVLQFMVEADIVEFKPALSAYTSVVQNSNC